MVRGFGFSILEIGSRLRVWAQTLELRIQIWRFWGYTGIDKKQLKVSE
jgi:hypothetical protein